MPGSLYEQALIAKGTGTWWGKPSAPTPDVAAPPSLYEQAIAAKAAAPAPPPAQPSIWSRMGTDIVDMGKSAINALNPFSDEAAQRRQEAGAEAIAGTPAQNALYGATHFTPLLSGVVDLPRALKEQVVPAAQGFASDFTRPLDETKGPWAIPARIGKTALDAMGLAFSPMSAQATAMAGQQAQRLTGIDRNVIGQLPFYAEGAIKAATFMRGALRAKGIEHPNLSDEQLVTGALDGQVPGITPEEAHAILKEHGVTPSSDAEAVRLASRAQGAQERVPPNLGEGGMSPKKAAAELARRQALSQGVEAGTVDPAAAPTVSPRTVPSDIPMFAAPEGTIRGDDPGAMAGVERKRAADANVLDQVIAEADPTIREILNHPSASTDQKVAAIWDRIKARDTENRTPAPGTHPVDNTAPETPPHLRPNAAEASGARDAIVLPVRGRVSSKFGHRSAFRTDNGAQASTNHGGVDIAAPEGSPIAATRGGTVTMAGPAGANGNLVRIDHGNGVVTAYAHMHGVDVKIGDTVKAGDTIGTVGQTGNATGPHVHYGVKVNGKAVDPETFRFPRGAEPDTTPRYTVPPRPEDWTDTGSPAERPRAQPSPTQAEYDAGAVHMRPDGTFTTDNRFPAYEAPMATRGAEPRRVSPDEPGGPQAGQPGADHGPAQTPPFSPQPDGGAGPTFKGHDYFRSTAEENMAAMQREYEASQSKRRERQEKARQEQRQQSGADRDPKDAHGSYDQKPHMNGDFWHQTEDGFIAGKNDKPVAFRNAKEAARWATANKMAGDFELQSWGTSARGAEGRVVLKRRDNSTYGQPQPEAPKGPAEPFAGRSPDESQRAIPAPERPAEPIQPEAAPKAAEAPKPPEQAAAPTEAPVSRPASPTPSREPLTGRSEEVVTHAGSKADTQFQVHEASDLITSDHPAFDPALQPRERGSRAASDAQVSDIASRLDPEQLHSSRLASQGAPIVGPDRMVESGNGRVAAIRRAYQLHPEKAAAYRRMIEAQGHDTTGFKEPVLVRRRTSEMSPEKRQAFTREAQSGGTMKMSSTEQAAMDAKSMSHATLGHYRGGDVAGAGNREFVRKFMGEAVDKSEHNTMMQPDGTLSVDGIRRVKQALLAKAYDDPSLIAKITEDADTEIKAIGNVLTDMAPHFAQMKQRIAAGELGKEFDITPQIAEMAKLVARSRNEGIPLADLLKTDDMFGGKVDPTTEALAHVFFKGEEMGKPRSAQAMQKGLQHYVDEAGKTDSRGDLLGGADTAPKAADLLNNAAAKLDAPGAEQNDMFRRPMAGSSKEEVQSRVERLDGELQKIADSHQNRHFRELADALKPLVNDKQTVEFGTAGLIDKSAYGEADVAGGKAYVADPKNAEAVLHETIHLVAESRLGSELENIRPGDAVSGPATDLVKLYEEAKTRFAKSRTVQGSQQLKAGLSNIHEFLTYSQTNKRFQALLEKGTLWHRTVDAVRKLIGLDPKFRPMLERVMRAGGDLIEGLKKDEAGSAPNRPAPEFGKRRQMVSEDKDPAEQKTWERLADKVVDVGGLKKDAAGIKEAIGNPKTTLEGFTQPMQRMVSAAFFSNDARLRSLAGHFKSDAIKELADKFFARPGKGDATPRTLHEAVDMVSHSYTQRAFDALEPFLKDEAAMARIRDLLTEPNNPRLGGKASERVAAKSVAGLLKDMIEYRKDAGETIGEVKDGYFPRDLNVETVVKRRDEFLRIAEKLYTSIGVSNAKGAASAWFDRVFDTYAGLDGAMDHAGAVGANTAKAREFGKEADRLLKDFYHQDPFQTLSSYFRGASKRAEYNRRFGTPGREGSAERTKWTEEHGAKNQRDVLTERIKDDVRASREDAAGALRVVDQVMRSQLGQMGTSDPFVRKVVSDLHVWNQLSKMPRVVFTSLGELTMGFVRGGPKYGLPFLKDTVTEFGRLLAKAHPSEAARWGEAVGVASDAIVGQHLAARETAEGSTLGAQKVLTSYYKKVGLYQFSEGERVAAAQMGRKFITDLSHDMNSPNARTKVRAGQYLRELGVKDPEAFAAQFRKQEPLRQDVLADKPGMAADYRTALYRFVQQTMMQPSRAEKPTWAQHPVGGLFFSLSGYSYAFKKNVLDRAARMGMQALKDKDPRLLAPAFGLSVLVGLQALNTRYLIPNVFGSGYDFNSETTPQMMLRVADRAGLTGAASPVINAVQGVKYRRSLAESLAGPIVGTLADFGNKTVQLATTNSPNTNSTERAFAGAIFDSVIEPAIAVTAATRLQGALGSAAIYGTAGKPGGILPSPREKFIDTVAGKKQ